MEPKTTSIFYPFYSLADPWVMIFAFIPKKEQTDVISPQLDIQALAIPLALSPSLYLPIADTLLVKSMLHFVLSWAVLSTSIIKDLSVCSSLIVPLEGETVYDSLKHLLTPEGDLNDFISGWVNGRTELSEFTCQRNRGVFCSSDNFWTCHLPPLIPSVGIWVEDLTHQCVTFTLKLKTDEE